MELKHENIFITEHYPENVTMTDAIIAACEHAGFNTIYDDDDEVVMQNSNMYLCLTTKPDGTIIGTYYKR